MNMDAILITAVITALCLIAGWHMFKLRLECLACQDDERERNY